MVPQAIVLKDLLYVFIEIGGLHDGKHRKRCST